MTEYFIDEKDVVDYIFDTLYSSKIKLNENNLDCYHHNTSYSNAPLICKYGILSLNELNRHGIRNDSKELLEKMSDIESHINGINSVSLALMGLDDLYKNEYEYNPYNPSLIDFQISKNIDVSRSSLNYGNEFIHKGNIKVGDIRSLDFRIMKFIKDNPNISSDLLINMYNSLLQCALNIEENSSNIIMREMSLHNSFQIDIDKFSKNKCLILEKK